MSCEKCNKSFSKFSNYKAHVKEFHPADFNQVPPHKPKENAVAKCAMCRKEFVKHYNLKKHMERFHDATFEKKVYNFKCDMCNKQFSHLRHFTYHQKSHGVQSNNNIKFLKCPICYEDFQKQTVIINHFDEEHSIKVETDVLQFPTFEEFKAWKTENEKNTKSSFVKPHGSYSTQGAIKTKYICHRSGDFTSKSKQRRLKAQGSNKINGFCPAGLKVTEETGVCEVLYTKTHVGHDSDVRHLFLTESERAELAAKIAAEVPLDSILDEVRNSVTDCELDRLHLLTKKDLFNIAQCFKLNSSSVQDRNDAVSMESWGENLVELPESQFSGNEETKEDNFEILPNITDVENSINCKRDDSSFDILDNEETDEVSFEILPSIDDEENSIMCKRDGISFDNLNNEESDEVNFEILPSIDDEENSVICKRDDISFDNLDNEETDEVSYEILPSIDDEENSKGDDISFDNLDNEEINEVSYKILPSIADEENSIVCNRNDSPFDNLGNEEIIIIVENSMDLKITESVSEKREEIDDLKKNLQNFKNTIMLQLDNIKTLDEFEAVKKICASIQPTIDAIRNSQNITQNKIAVIPQNKKINKPRRLYSTKK